MKTFSSLMGILLLFLVFVTQPQILSAQNATNTKKQMVVEKISAFDNFYQGGNYYFSGQPDMDALKWAKQQGVKTVINLRSDGENNEFTRTAFNEKKVIADMGMAYYSVPISGKETYSPESLKGFGDILESQNGKVLIHCRSGRRVTYLMMAYLIKYRGYSMQEAKKFGSQMSYFSYIDGLLGTE